MTNEFRTVGPFELNWETQQYKCWISQYITFALLAVLQLVNLFWFFLILRIGWRFLRASELADERSEYEEDTEEVLEKEGLERVEGVEGEGVLANGGGVKAAPPTPVVQLNGEAVGETPATGFEQREGVDVVLRK